jgi:dUTP pyrophosphatase
MKLVVQRLDKDAVLPTRKHPTDAGIDFYSLGDHLIHTKTYKVIRTGITVRLPENTFMLLKPKSRNFYVIGGGVVDEDYDGEILFKVFNVLNHYLVIKRGDAIGQGVILPVHYPEIVVANRIYRDNTARTSEGISIQVEDYAN